MHHQIICRDTIHLENRTILEEILEKFFALDQSLSETVRSRSLESTGNICPTRTNLREIKVDLASLVLGKLPALCEKKPYHSRQGLRNALAVCYNEGAGGSQCAAAAQPPLAWT